MAVVIQRRDDTGAQRDGTANGPVFALDAYSLKEVALRVEESGVAKARRSTLATAMLGVLAGAYIGFAALAYTLITSDTALGFAWSRVLGGLSFSLGLILVVVAGTELFTGNNLLVMAWADRRISTIELLRNWAVVFVSNAAGATGLVILVLLSGHAHTNDGAVALNAVKIATAKVSLPFWELFFRGILCNVLVCMAVWLSMAGRTVSDKILAVIFPITAFVAAGFEHSIANMYFIPLGILLKSQVPGGSASLDWAGYAENLLPVTLGNIVGGGVLVALVYFVIYRLGAPRVSSDRHPPQ
jgi:formate/nitrite transporter